MFSFRRDLRDYLASLHALNRDTFLYTRLFKLHSAWLSWKVEETGQIIINLGFFFTVSILKKPPPSFNEVSCEVELVLFEMAIAFCLEMFKCSAIQMTGAEDGEKGCQTRNMYHRNGWKLEIGLNNTLSRQIKKLVVSHLISSSKLKNLSMNLRNS